MIASDGKVHLIRCDMGCGTQDGHASVSVRCFVDAMRALRWEFYQAEDGSYDSICPDCARKRQQPGEVKILHGRA